MKSTFTTLLILLAICSATCVLTGCEEANKLAQCEQSAADLQVKLNEQEKEVARLKVVEQSYGVALIEAITTNETMKKEMESLMKEVSQLKLTNTPEQKDIEVPGKEVPQSKQTYTPEQQENIRKGMEQLRKLQQESAERMRKEAAEKSAE